MYQNIYIERSQEGKVVHLWDDRTGHTEFPYKDFDYAYKIHPQGTIPSLLGPLTKKVHRYSREDPLIIESDLPMETRVLTDLYLDSDEPAEGNRIAIIDIEVDVTDGLPDIQTADKEITSIALEDRVTGDEYVFILDKTGELDDLDDAEFENVTILNAHSEKELLEDFLDIWEQINPTIITGWNIDYFDIPYLYRRILSVLGWDEVMRLSPVGLVKYNERRGKFQIAGISTLDYLDLYKKFTYTQQPNYRLDTIGKIEVDQGKYEYEGTLADLKESDIKGFLQYNLDDIRIVSKIDKKMKLIELVMGICTVGHVPYEDYGYSSRWLEGALVTDLHRKGIVCPNKSAGAQSEMQKKDKSGKKGFVGAYVKEPKSGRHEWVFSLDLQSLYPSIIMSLNISPETKIGKIIGWDLHEYMRGEDVEYMLEDLNGSQSPIDRDQLTAALKGNKFTISSNGIMYSTDKVGLIPETLDRWFGERLEYKDKMKAAKQRGDDEQADYYDMRQHIQKIFLNSLYGVLGLPIFRFYDIDNALAVTATGQDVIKTTAKYVNKRYNELIGTKDEDYCIYIDTDSVYFSVTDLCQKMGGQSFDDWKKMAITTARQMESQLNEMYNYMAKSLFFIPGKHRFVIKGETIASAAFWVTKKRYAMKKVYDLEANMDLDGKVAVKGLDVVRSSFPAAFRKFMKDVLVDILDDVPQSDLDPKILAFFDKLPDMPMQDIARNTAVKNVSKYLMKNQRLGEFALRTPAHVKAAITHNLLLEQWGEHRQYTPITNGVKIKWVYLSQNPHRIESVAFFGSDDDSPSIVELVENYIDYERIFEKEFAHKLSDFYKALGWGKIPTEVNQMADDFFAF